MKPGGLQPARVRVPCSTSNLGSGFDCVGLALDRYLDATFEPADGPIRVERSGSLASLALAVEDDTAVRALRDGLAARGYPHIGGLLRMTSEIPVSRGLGSSAAAAVAGLALAVASSGVEIDREGLLAMAAGREGHPDNAAPALFGGLVGIAADADGTSRPFRLPLSPRIGFAWAAPPVEVSTAYARTVLPARVPHATATRALGRIAALVHGLAEGDPDLLRIGFEDELHVPFRLPLIPGAAAAIEAASVAGAWAVTISGSGSGLIAVCPVGSEPAVADAMGAALRAAGEGEGEVLAFPVRPDRVGVRVVEP